jgi:hypothetical protein
VQTRHTQVWQQGYRAAAGAMKIGVLNAGCGACHHAQSEKHGEVPNCLTCHPFGGSQGEAHKAHLDRITAHADDIDPKRPAQMSPCAYCHYESDTAASRSNAACYNCHLSGHQPLDGTGKAHFWPVSD